MLHVLVQSDDLFIDPKADDLCEDGPHRKSLYGERPDFSTFRLRRANHGPAKLVIRRKFPRPNSIATAPLDWPCAWRWATNHSLRKGNLAKPQGGRDARQASDGEFG
jgi:hypothetical protein